MAIEPKVEYPAQTIASDPAYPHGKARNVTVAGDGTGTPLEQTWLNDLWGFLQAILSYGGVTPSGTPDTASASDYLDALKAKFGLVGPASATDLAVAIFDGVTGKVVKNSGVTIDGSNNVVTAGEHRYPSSKTRTVRIPGCAFNGGGSGYPNLGTYGHCFVFNQDTQLAFLDLSSYIRTSEVLASVDIRVKPGAARSSPSCMRAYYELAVGDSTLTTIGPADDDGTTGVQSLSLAMAHTVNRATSRYSVRVQSGNTASTNADTIIYADVTFADFGPRND